MNFVGDNKEPTRSPQWTAFDYTDSALLCPGVPSHRSAIQETELTAIGRGRRPSLSQIATIQKQTTIEDEEFDEKCISISPPIESSKDIPGLDYYDSTGLFAGLRQDYAWCSGSIIFFNLKTIIRIIALT